MTCSYTAQLHESATQEYERNGYIVIRQFASPEDVCQLRQRAEHIVAEQYRRENSSEKRTLDQGARKELCEVCRKNGAVRSQAPAEYLISSARSIRCFWDNELTDQEERCSETWGNEEKPALITKIGHALHDVDPVFRAFTRSDKVCNIFSSILKYRHPTPVQSMLMFKQLKLKNAVAAHQDSTYLHTTPVETCVGFWVALQDADSSSGCLEMAPQSHLHGLGKLMVLDGNGPETKIIELKSKNNLELLSDEEYIKISVEAGDAVIFDGLMWHRSGTNISAETRLAYTFHTVDLGISTYDEKNWLQPGEFPFEALY